MGAHVSVISRSESKRASCLAMGADEFVNSSDPQNLTPLAGKFDMIINTVSAKHDIISLVNLLTFEGTMVMVGAGPDAFEFRSGPLIMQRRRIVGSLIGGIKETQEMLDFCGKHNIVCDIELIPADKINEAYDRTIASDVKYRFVIDASTF